MGNDKRHNHFIGFRSFEDWRAVINPDEAVYAAASVTADAAGQMGIYIVRHVITVAQIDREDNVLYARATTDRYDSMDGATPMWHPEQHQLMSESAWELTLDWLESIRPGLAIRKAVIAAPKDLVLLNGVAGFMRVDKEKCRWAPVQAEAPVAA